MELETLIDQYLSEKIGIGKLTIKRATALRTELVGLSSHITTIGFVRFLKAQGYISPSTADLNGANIGHFYEFLIQHQGALQSYRAMRALRHFWIWAKNNHFIPRVPMPLDLKTTGVAKPVHVKFSITVPR